MLKKIILLLPSLFITITFFAQVVDGRLKFEQGQSFEIALQSKTTVTQQAMGQTIDFNVDASATHTYKVTNTTEDNHTLNHTIQRIAFAFNGMGSKQAIDSDKPKDLNGQFGKPIKEMLDKKYDMIIDPYGKVRLAMPESFPPTTNDNRMAIITNMMKDILVIVQPPKREKASFFGIIPFKEGGVAVGDTWTENEATEKEKSSTTYTVESISDSVVVINFTGTSSSVSKAEMMGNETTTTMSHTSAGKIIVDRTTAVMKEKTITIDSKGTTESSFGSLPVTSKTTSTISVKPIEPVKE